MATKSEVIKMMTVMALAWPRYEMPKEAFEVYYQILKDLPSDALETASHHLMASNTFFPSISEWRKAAIDLITPQVPTEYEAWQEVMDQLRLIGSYGIPRFSHPLIQRAVETMGWRQLCGSEHSDYDRAHFYKAYSALRDRAIDDTRMLPEVRSIKNGAIQVKDYAKLLSGEVSHD